MWGFCLILDFVGWRRCRDSQAGYKKNCTNHNASVSLKIKVLPSIIVRRSSKTSEAMPSLLLNHCYGLPWVIVLTWYLVPAAGEHPPSVSSHSMWRASLSTSLQQTLQHPCQVTSVPVHGPAIGDICLCMCACACLPVNEVTGRSRSS